jgi:phosphoribosylformimino-5-aminoimidazole carboxamide ribotide isomerase
MIAIPAVDLREGACVQLVGGSYAREHVRMPDPVAVARRWIALGFRRLHVVDLDAATGRGSNAAVVAAVLDATAGLEVEVQVAGGVRDEATIGRWLAAGARRVVIGTRALEEPDWLAAMAARFPDRILVAADARGRRLATRGWRHTLARGPIGAVRGFDALPLAGLLVTAVHREGRLAGTDLPLMRAIAAASRLPVIASGGITTMEDLRSLAACGIAGAVIGMAFYTGVLDARGALEEFAT